ncbi:carboxypeptidase-like regulatory domain-containing protein [Sphingobacterium paludis]|uniref:Carboxypeptidase-like protein n=1 Tax=Sphingobacterium paludis TaxID=1476465 RepID=A0A4R7CSM0_9SPHI|nr:carboxypeptidase-like regulatory domain-containing protein [Sphingobacterium paludis]TDS11001.1 carboxypeptidase-like protein [Sphingobacterium paludis]
MKINGVWGYFVLFLLSLLSTVAAQGQQTSPIINASLVGKVIDANTKEPIEGATVQLEAVTHSVKTDAEGQFQFVTGQKLPFAVTVSYLGYEQKKLVISISPTVIALDPKISGLDEVVVVGYGAIKRKDLTGSVASLPSELLKQNVSSLDQVLKGGVSGVQVTHIWAARRRCQYKNTWRRLHSGRKRTFICHRRLPGIQPN